MLRLFPLFLVVAFASTALAEYEVVRDDDGLTIKRDGQLVTRYVIQSGSKPILYPVIGPDGIAMTRRYPIEEAGEHEREDHPHHRSIWITHGDVTGIDFWAEKEGAGRTVHESFEEISDGKTAKVVTKNRWEDAEGNLVGRDVRTLSFGTDDGMQYIDFDITFLAGEKEVTFGDTKEGSFGVRVPGTMKVDAKRGGAIVNSEGIKDKEAWAKRAAWVDYYGPVHDKTGEEKTVGIAILNHPTSYNFPTYWHVRTYGLFAANPFGRRDFEGKDAESGAHVIPAGGKMHLRYRVLLHEGTTKDAGIAAAFERYQKVEK